MPRMKLIPFAAVAGLLLGGLLAYATPADAWPAQNGCVTEVHACSSGSCSRPIPDGGVGRTADGGLTDAMDAGIPLAFVQGFTVRVCGTFARPLAGAGTLKDYHIASPAGTVTEVTSNALSVTQSGGPPYCQEFPPFVLPQQLPSADRMVWASSGVTITNWDGGTADTVSVTVCPAQ